MADKKKCKELKADGTPCEAYAGPSGYCAFHDPAREVERAEERARGGTKAGVNKSARKLAPVRRMLKLDGPGDVIKMLKTVAYEVWIEPTTARFDVGKKARALATVAGVLLKAYELNDTDERLTLLESERGIN